MREFRKSVLIFWYDRTNRCNLNPTIFNCAIEKFDAANAQDPTLIAGIPAELVYARRMTDWLCCLVPRRRRGPSTRGLPRLSHIRRWMKSR